MSTYITKRAEQVGLKIFDAKEPMTLEVQTRDVTAATRKNSKCCAFAKAAERQVTDLRAAYFFRSTAYLEYGDRLVRYKLPVSVQKEIVSFDRAKITAPGTYQLSVPSKRQTLKSKRAQLKANKWSKGDVGTSGRRGGRLVHHTALVRTLHEPAYIITR